tara:strand:+ start:298 stop:627 length:330 start_codon:yes stop_codon:yes gene_type:complete
MKKKDLLNYAKIAKKRFKTKDYGEGDDWKSPGPSSYTHTLREAYKKRYLENPDRIKPKKKSNNQSNIDYYESVRDTGHGPEPSSKHRKGYIKAKKKKKKIRNKSQRTQY